MELATVPCCVCMEATRAQCPQCSVHCCNKDLGSHRSGGFCQPWQLSCVPGVGRVLVAGRDIAAWERVLYDTALLLAPADSPVCLGCLAKVDGSSRCTHCNWAICKVDCQDSLQHKEECCILQAHDIVPSVKDWNSSHWTYASLAVLRVLLAYRSSSDNQNTIQNLMDHWESRVLDLKVCEGLDKMTSFFKQRLHMDWISLSDVQHAFGVLKTNAVAAAEGRALFPMVSMLSHSCNANLEPLETPFERAVFRAKRNIRQGEELSMRYTSNLTSKYIIQEELSRDWLFACCCSRCVDPTEFNSFFSSPQCKCGLYFLKKTVRNDQKKEDILECSGCHLTKDFASQITREKMILKEILSMSQDKLLAMEDKLRLDGYHTNNHIIFNLKLRFLDVVDICNEEALIQVSQAAQQVLSVLSMIDPGFTKISGKYLMLMLEAEIRLIQAKKRRGEVKDDQYRESLKSIIQGKLRATKLNSKFYI